MGFLEKLWSKKIQFQMQGPKTLQKHVQNMRNKYTHWKKICFPKGTVPGKDSSQEYVNFVKKITKKPKPLFDRGIFQHEPHSTHHFLLWLLCFTCNDRDLCVPSLKLVRRHGPYSGRIWPKILVRHGWDLKMLRELCIKDVVNNEELLMDKFLINPSRDCQNMS